MTSLYSKLLVILSNIIIVFIYSISGNKIKYINTFLRAFTQNYSKS